MSDPVREWSIRYRAHNQLPRPAFVLAPAEYGPNRPTPRLPLMISPHGRGVRAKTNLRLWSNLPGRGGFVVVSPGGMGRRLPLHSWGYPRQIADLARMPSIVEGALPWIKIDKRRVYACGGSMGGHESLLLLGQYPDLLKGVVAIDPVTNFFRRYTDFGLSVRTRGLQVLARIEVGGTPKTNPTGYVLRSPTHWLKEVARSGVDLQLWWSLADAIVLDQIHQSAHFYGELKRLNHRGRLDAVTGNWPHSKQMRQIQLPQAMRWLGLLDDH
ncbi:MAG: alpha/beta hydrolase family protein [Gaiellaceae bacterium]